MKKQIPLCWIVIGLAALLVGCQDPTTQAGKINAPSAMPENAKEKLGEKRLADALKGLDLKGKTIQTASASRDRAKSLRLTANAARIHETENAWWLTAGRYRDAIVADPTYAKAYEGLGIALAGEGGADLVKKAFATALQLDPSLSEARFRMGLISQAEGQYDQAINEWKTLAQHHPNHPDLYSRMAIASYYAGNYAASWRYLDQATARKEATPPQFKDLLKETSPRP